jgi:hypothetical protein
MTARLRPSAFCTSRYVATGKCGGTQATLGTMGYLSS